VCNNETRDGSVQVRPASINLRAVLAVALLATAVAGCNGLGGPKTQQAAVPAADPNAYPANYRSQILGLLRESLGDRADYRGALISQPMLKPVAGSQRYVVCLQFNGHSQIKNKVAIYLAGEITQFIDSTSVQCADAAYQPYQELEKATPE
jgi:hypothetical protein